MRPRSSKGAIRRLLAEGRIDVITFTSASTVNNFVGLFKKGEAAALTEGVKIAVIGPITERACRERGLSADIMPSEYTIPGLVRAMEAFYSEE